MPKDFEFEGSGHRGAVFEQKGLQERNINNLITIFGSAEATQTLTELAKVKKDQWKAMGQTIEILENFIEGGVVGGFRDIGQDLKESLSLTVEEALSPLKNEVEQALADALTPIMPQIQAFTTEIANNFVIAIKSWEAILTGQWDDFFKFMSDNMSDDMKVLKNTIRDWWDKLFTTTPISGTPLINRDTSIIVDWWMSFWEGLGWK